MKTLLLILVSSMALASNIKELNCHVDLSKQNRGNGIQSISLKGTLIADWIKNAVATVVSYDYRDKLVTTVGRSAQFESDSNYRPVKHKNSFRFDLSKLTDVKDFGSFMPDDLCQIYVMIPKDAEKFKSFTASVQFRCDQSGGVETMSCMYR